MTDQEYQRLAMVTAPKVEDITITDAQKRLLLGALGMVGEAGEVADMVKKHVFHGHPWDEAVFNKFLRELGDVDWYHNYLITSSNTTPGEVKAINIAKLQARYPNGFESVRSIHRQEGDI